jgi:chloramphenicol-sensitive protein RarD
MRKGLLYATICYSLWGMFPLYFKAIKSLAPLEILLHRMVWSLLFLAGVLAYRRQWAWITIAFQQPKLIGGFAASAALLSINWFIYIWSVNNGHVIDASLGYFMTPLVSVLLGFVFLHERLRTAQWCAVSLAALAVLWLTWQTGHLPWIGLCLATTFGIYGLLRKTAVLGALEGLSLEVLLLFPFAFGYLAYLYLHAPSGNGFFEAKTNTQLLLVAAGPITAIPLLLFAAAARRIPMASLGLLQYISPTLQLLLGVFFFQEQFSANRVTAFAGIWLALVIYSAEGLRHTYFNKNREYA